MRLPVLLLLALFATFPAWAQAFPRQVEHAYGSAEIAAAPQRVLALSDIDFDIALALGVEPVASANAGYNNEPTAPYHLPFLDTWTGEEPSFFTLNSGVPFEAVAAADPDLILATGAWSLDTDYERLSDIAPVVAVQGDRDAPTTWQDKTRTAGLALGKEAEGEALIARIEARFAKVAADNPTFAGKTIAYGVVHPWQLTYMSIVGDTSTTFFQLLGFALPPTASQFDANNVAVSREQLYLFDADVLLFAYPFEGEASVSQAKLEADPLFQRIPAVAAGHYLVVPQIVASSLAYPSPLSTLWALDEMLPALQRVTAE